MALVSDVMVPMRDGVRLATDIYRPETSGKLPALIARTPYNKDGMSNHPDISAFVEAGYVVAVQDVRGRYASEGDFYPYVTETDDALDFYEWVLNQDWCDGTIGTFGGSYLGGTQTLPARKTHPAVKAMIPEITFDDNFKNAIYQGGAKVMHDLVWTVGSIIPEMVRRAGLTLEELKLPTPEAALCEIPLASHPSIKKWGAFYHDWLEHSTECEYWDKVSPHTGYDGMTMPALNISGWYDIFVPSTINNFVEMRKRNKDTRLIMGPWTHMNFSGVFPEISFGESSSADALGLTQIKVDWFEKHVKGDNTVPNGSPVKIFTMGINQWRDEDDWPLPGTRYEEFYLHSDGKLSSDKPGDEQPDSYTYDPMNPVPTIGGGVILPGDNSSGPKDQSALYGSRDILSYTTEPFEKPLEVTGSIVLKLFISSDCRDTDFTGKLVDVYPDGRAMLLTDGILRARFRESLKEPKLLMPGEIYELTIELGATSNVFLPGHRLQIDISSSNFPKYNRNSNTGGDIATEIAEKYKQANNTVYHDGTHMSLVILPVIER